MNTKQDLIDWIENNRSEFTSISDEIWANPEIAFHEFKASKIQADYLESKGFKVTWDIGGMNTAFVAEWGKGKPIIGFLGEYDALLNLSQKSQPDPEPIVPGGMGHGCGHQLLGTGCMAGAVAIRYWLESNHKSGTVRYYGCPAEENGNGKIYMVRDGLFDDLDVAFNYHPDAVNTASKGSSVGVMGGFYRFHGITAHAGGAPHLGRSALDAVELMNVGVNYLREHVTKNVRMHYVITHGGDLPNIVPAEAEVWYFLRAQYREELEEVAERVSRIAQGAALMTETTLEEIRKPGCTGVLSNHYLADLQYEAMKVIGPIQYTEEELDFGKRVNQHFPAENQEYAHQLLNKSLRRVHLPERDSIPPIMGENFPALDEGEVATGSTDVGDASWVTPISMLSTACWSTSVPGHSWGNVASGAMSIGHKGMLHAAKIMALAAMDCYMDESHIKKAREEFEKNNKAHPYRCPYTKNDKPEQFENPERK
jgi:aminobenzoyl-glutamate utilization protein B